MTDPQIPAPYGAVPPYAPAPPPAAPGAPYGQQAPAYQQPGYPAPAGAYQVPVGGYQEPMGGYAAPAPVAPRPALLGIIALVSSLIAGVVTSILVGIACVNIGRHLPGAFDVEDFSNPSTLAFLSPVRDHVLLAEVSFWAGTVLGIGAIILGIMAIVQRRGRGAGIAGLIIAVLAPFAFFTVATFALTYGAALGMPGFIS